MKHFCINKGILPIKSVSRIFVKHFVFLIFKNSSLLFGSYSDNILCKMKKSLSTSLNLILCSFVICFFGTLLASSVYMVYSMCQNLVAGQTSTFSIALFFKGLLVTTPCVFEVLSLFLIFYLIRHPSDNLLPITTYGIIGVICWFFVIPSLFHLQNSFIKHPALEEKRETISAGYFRSIDDHIVYISNVSSEGNAEGVIFDLLEDTDRVSTFTDAELIIRKEGFQDSIIQDSISATNFMKETIFGVGQLQQIMANTESRGYRYWLSVASLGLALLSVAGFRNISEWRLLAVLAVFITFSCVILFNTLININTGIIYDSVMKMNNSMSGLKFLYNPVQIICNVTFSVGMVLVGFLLDSKDRKARRKVEEE